MTSEFLYKERQKRKTSTINGVVSTPDYSTIELNAVLKKKIQKESNKRAR